MILSFGAGLCRPFAYDWDKSIPGGKCSELDRTYISIAALDILGDAMIIGKHAYARLLKESVQTSWKVDIEAESSLALPMLSIWKLQISTSTKIGLSEH